MYNIYTYIVFIIYIIINYYIMDTRPNHKNIQEKWQNKWISEKTFKSVVDDRPKFSMTIPPANVTGTLHAGHALNATFQDTYARHKRQQGYNVCWVPGTDHAGIATQVKVQKELEKKNIKSNELSREEFLKYIWKWKNESGSTIINQLKMLGCSCDWDRECFTMDESFSEHVKDIFIKLYNDKLIYQGDYLINWDPCLETAIADDEVDTTSIKSKLYYIKYYNKNNINDKKDYIVIATTRPETIFGDMAIGYNHLDDKFKLNTNTYLIPIIDKEINLVSDEFVDKDFGSGLVKITPAHDKFDFEFAQRHNLKAIQIIDKKGKIYNTGTKYDGLNILAARKTIVKELNDLGHIEKIEEYDSVQKICSRSGAQVENLITSQWFINMKPLVQPLIKMNEDKEISIYPENQISLFNNWIENIRPWCISRQLIWGHTIPIFNCTKCNKQIASKNTVEYCCETIMTQEPGVLDTWFSSWLWPYGVFNDTELSYYFPTDIMITGSDILFFWVIRMMVASKYMKNKIPFSKVYLHGLVRDEKNKKMSKSLGNAIDPLILIDKFGCDPVRFTLLMTTPYDSDVAIGESAFKIGKTFCTKFWNIVRYITMYLKDNNIKINNFIDKYENNSEEDNIIIDKFNDLTQNIDKHLENFEFAKATNLLYSFVWDDFANKYLEYTKDKMDKKINILVYLLYNILKKSEAFIPHISNELMEILMENY